MAEFTEVCGRMHMAKFGEGLMLCVCRHNLPNRFRSALEKRRHRQSACRIRTLGKRNALMR